MARGGFYADPCYCSDIITCCRFIARGEGFMNTLDQRFGNAVGRLAPSPALRPDSPASGRVAFREVSKRSNVAPLEDCPVNL